MVTPAAVTIKELVEQYPSKRSLAVIVTNDYGTTHTLKSLEGPKIDRACMQSTFTQLQIATYYKKNVGRGEIMILLK